MLQFFSASTGIVNSKRAITECIENALEGEPNLDCDLIIIYTAMGHNFKELLSEAHKLCPDAQVTGCTCGGIIGKEGPDESLKALAIMVVKGPKDEFVVSGITYSHDGDMYDTGSKQARDLKNKIPGINMIFCHPGIGIPAPWDINKFIEGVESVFGPDTPIVGGLSSDNNKFMGNFQFIGERIIEVGSIMIGFADPTLELISLGHHGFDIIGKPFEVTHSEDLQIFEMDGQPAWKIWTERLGVPETSSEALVFSPLARKLPEELHEEYDSPYMIQPIVPSPEGHLQCGKAIKEGTKLWLTRRNEDKIFDGVDRMMIRILERCEGRKPVAVFHADCFARGKILFNRIRKDEIVSKFQDPLCKDEKIPWLGMYAGGELTPLSGKNQLQMFTTSLYVLVKRKSADREKKVQ